MRWLESYLVPETRLPIVRQVARRIDKSCCPGDKSGLEAITGTPPDDGAFPQSPREESTVLDSTRQKPNHVKYAAMLLDIASVTTVS